jgi:hypothetical protein
MAANTWRDKYALTREQNIFLAKKKWDENIYCGMKMEGRNVTFPETQTILSGVNVARVSLNDVQAILNMRDAWRYLLTSINAPLSLDELCRLNGFVSRNESLAWGVLRTGAVGIAGVSWRPPVPDADEAVAELNATLERALRAETGATETALDVFLWGARRQLFWDGNKRTFLLAANKLLIAGGGGILTVRDAQMVKFNSLLSGYYESGSGDELKKFLYENAIDGINF